MKRQSEKGVKIVILLNKLVESDNKYEPRADYGRRF